MKNIFLIITILITFNLSISQETDIIKQVTHHYANNDGVKIHYVEMGEGPMILFVHGFPDFWFTWRHQMEALSKTHKVVAMDLRGYNLSDSPSGVENYKYNHLTKDILAVIKDTGAEKVNIVAHDWGASISWRFAANYPQHVEKMVILSISHPNAGDKKSTVVKKDEKPTYADYFVSEEFSNQLTANWFSGWVKDHDAKEIYKEAFRNSSKEAMMNYYRANFPTLQNLEDEVFLKNRKTSIPNIKSPVLIIHGEKDTYAPTENHNNTWKFVNNEVTIKVLPNAGHFIQQDESEKVTQSIQEFLK